MQRRGGPFPDAPAFFRAIRFAAEFAGTPL